MYTVNTYERMVLANPVYELGLRVCRHEGTRQANVGSANSGRDAMSALHG
jgi:hypothetical protein